ncbi:uncharacterized protein BX663DRAFT_564919 [Cokeromyces recurvatus]|uniref:uncharacterized protein n=1 Tax=Cokeromyces recurvatus TaxID=90255 RepID=UPI0022201EE5|nr:uncharacterized protein BX663DRAFT_564919 [Cokeromyces recurvatus]KAI7898263.1 hypothetical protein BX663DRAFT_564919 [Cokeromyces recurvatus]
MESHPILTAHLLLEGAVIGLSVELFFRALFSNKQRCLVRCLKMIMSAFMAIKSTIFSSNINIKYCGIVERVGEAFYHVGCIAGFIILLLRLEAIISIQHRSMFRIFHVILILIRIIASILDLIYLRVWVGKTCDCCELSVARELGVFYALFDALLDGYVSFMITFILCRHIRELNVERVQGNVNLYISVVLSNVIRTVVLTIVSIACAVYYLSTYRDPILPLIIWPVTNVFFILLIGYDTNITNALKSVRSQFLGLPQTNSSLSNVISQQQSNMMKNKNNPVFRRLSANMSSSIIDGLPVT